MGQGTFIGLVGSVKWVGLSGYHKEKKEKKRNNQIMKTITKQATNDVTTRATTRAMPTKEVMLRRGKTALRAIETTKGGNLPSISKITRDDIGTLTYAIYIYVPSGGACFTINSDLSLVETRRVLHQLKAFHRQRLEDDRAEIFRPCAYVLNLLEGGDKFVPATYDFGLLDKAALDPCPPKPASDSYSDDDSFEVGIKIKKEFSLLWHILRDFCHFDLTRFVGEVASIDITKATMLAFHLISNLFINSSETEKERLKACSARKAWQKATCHLEKLKEIGLLVD